LNVRPRRLGRPSPRLSRRCREGTVKDNCFVFDAHTGYWDASPENTKNRYGEAFVETFYAFHTGFNPAGQPQ
jgi:hypothetical protein